MSCFYCGGSGSLGNVGPNMFTDRGVKFIEIDTSTTGINWQLYNEVFRNSGRQKVKHVDESKGKKDAGGSAKNLFVAFRCGSCETTIAVFRAEDKQAMQRAVKEKMGTLCPRCCAYIEKDSLRRGGIVIALDDDETRRFLEIARNDKVLFEDDKSY